MAYFRCGGGGVPASVKTDMNDVLNKKFGTSTDYPPADWAPTVNLMGPLPEKTQASASVCSFDDGADDVPTKSLVVTIPPTLSGVSSVGVENEGNLCDFDDYNVEANTNTTVPLGADLTLRKGTYTLTFNISDTVTATRNRPCYVVNGNYTYADSDYKTSGRYSWTFTFSDETTLSIRWWAHTVSANITISDFMLTFGSTAHAYEPYTAPTQYTASLGRTIYGGQADIVNGTCEPINLLNTDEFVQRSGYNNLSVSVSNNVLTLSGYDSGGRFGCFNIQTEVGKDYTVKYTDRSNVRNVRVVESDIEPTNWINGGYAVGVNSAYTYTATKPWVQIWVEMTADNATVTDLQVELGITASAYSPYFEPFTFEGQEVDTLLGVNNFWSDSGDTEVTYRADIDLLLGGN